MRCSLYRIDTEAESYQCHIDSSVTDCTSFVRMLRVSLYTADDGPLHTVGTAFAIHCTRFGHAGWARRGQLRSWT